MDKREVLTAIYVALISSGRPLYHNSEIWDTYDAKKVAEFIVESTPECDKELENE